LTGIRVRLARRSGIRIDRERRQTRPGAPTIIDAVYERKYARKPRMYGRPRHFRPGGGIGTMAPPAFTGRMVKLSVAERQARNVPR